MGLRGSRKNMRFHQIQVAVDDTIVVEREIWEAKLLRSLGETQDLDLGDLNDLHR